MSDGFERDVHCLLGLPFDVVDVAGAVDRIREAATRRQSCSFSTPNLNFLVASLNDDAFRSSVIESDLNFTDGAPIIWIAKLLGVPIRERVAGSSVFENLRAGPRGQISVYFFGGREGVAEAACRRLNSGPSGLTCVGYESPGFGSIEDMSSDGTISRINASGADFVVVALGARKGQAWIARNRVRLSAPVVSHLGAVMNFVAGTVRRAPAWMQRSGLEWMWRITEEPGLWRRYLYDGLVFLRLVVTRVIPHAWFIYRHNPAGRELESAAFDLHDDGGDAVLRLRGAWVRDNLRPLRECFSRAALSGRNLRIDLERVSYVDTSFLGLLLLLYGAQTRHARRLSCGPVNRKVRRIFKYGCSEFLLSDRNTSTSVNTRTLKTTGG